MSNQVTVYSTDTCPYCTMMKNFLEQNNVAYTEVNVQHDQAAANRLVQTTGQMGVPQTNINGEWVLGFDPNRVSELLNA
ncbi:glutaredoxin [Planococcus halocryophilus Or1]|uniref:NrdH-redoxin n=1 Tax=Planococcus halocryophilus TaxID=1215089 RepID=A0A1C7DP00_9BACL|nr:glutaredoxin domain-containing protein [Planococcus halocryophilus]ANU13226.1 NrdH-redoxin [Planococcus halocryophilus]EMF45237.1 glutaredoxin [Planococcus halocryophilus Or1]